MNVSDGPAGFVHVKQSELLRSVSRFLVFVVRNQDGDEVFDVAGFVLGQPVQLRFTLAFTHPQVVPAIDE